MTLFLVLTAALVAAALWFVLRPLLRTPPAAGVSLQALNVALYREQLRELDAELAAGSLSATDHEAGKREIEARLLEDVGDGEQANENRKPSRKSAWAMGLGLPVLATAIYLVAGTPVALLPQVEPMGDQAASSQQIEEMTTQLAQRMQAEPDRVEGWVLLARSYMALCRFDEAASAYANAVQRAPEDAQLLVDYADALAMKQGRRLQGEPETLIAKALKLEPDNVKALALAGSAAFDRQAYRDAIRHWERVLTLVPADDEFARSVASSVREAKVLAGAPSAALPTLTAPLSTPTKATTAGSVQGIVRLAPSVAAKAAPTDTVFVFARAASGSRAPLAIVKAQVKDLPLSFTLDDSSAMAPAMNLSSQAEVQIVARVSKSGNATPQAGDLEGASATVSNRASGLVIVIDQATR